MTGWESISQPVVRSYRRARQRLELHRARNLVVSYPRSGRSWLRMMIGKALCLHAGLDDRKIFAWDAVYRASRTPGTAFRHEGRSGEWTWDAIVPTRRVLLLARDPRDIVVSHYHYLHGLRRRTAPGDISTFIRDQRQGIAASLRFLELWLSRRHLPAAFRVIRYEDLKAAPAPMLRQVFCYLDLPPLPDRTLEEAVQFCRFENMRRLEDAAHFTDGPLAHLARVGAAGPQARFVRRAQIGGYRKDLSAEDAGYLDMVFRRQGCALYDEADSEAFLTVRDLLLTPHEADSAATADGGGASRS